jgi:hypothetical protein
VDAGRKAAVIRRPESSDLTSYQNDGKVGMMIVGEVGMA